MSSASKGLLHEALVWAAVILGGFAAFYYFDDLRTLFNPEAGTGTALSRAERRESTAKPQGFAGEVRLNADARGHFVIDAAVSSRGMHCADEANSRSQAPGLDQAPQYVQRSRSYLLWPSALSCR